MFRRSLHVLAWLSVAAFLFANTHTSSALTTLMKPAKKSPGAAAKRSCCSHCQARQSEPAPPPSGIYFSAAKTETGSCPCCPERGPCPDDCVVCGVAKVPVTVTATFALPQSPTIAESWAEPDCFHILVYGGELMRPPRC